MHLVFPAVCLVGRRLDSYCKILCGVVILKTLPFADNCCLECEHYLKHLDAFSFLS